MGVTKEFEIDPKEVRKRLAMNQQEFWGRIGVAQSAGSRYESGRRMPKSVQELLRVVHIERIDLSHVHAQDFAVLKYLKLPLGQARDKRFARRHRDVERDQIHAAANDLLRRANGGPAHDRGQRQSQRDTFH